MTPTILPVEAQGSQVEGSLWEQPNWAVVLHREPTVCSCP